MGRFNLNAASSNKRRITSGVLLLTFATIHAAATIGGNLNIESLQDSSRYKESSQNTGVSVTIGPKPGGSLSAGASNINSNYQSVNEQSGIRAGDGGFQINVQGNTDLKGAVIAGSSDASKNTLTTNTLTTSDISNSMSASASSSGTSVGTDMASGKYALGKGLVGNAMNNGNANQNDSSTTTTAISAAQVTVGATTTDTSKNALTDSNGKTVSTDTANTHRTLAKADVAGLEQQAKQQQADNMLTVKVATAYTDEAYQTMYQAGGQMYRVPPGCSDKSCAVPLSEDEAKNLKNSQDGKLHISNNGIFNDLDGAVKYAQNHGGTMNADGSKNYSDKPENQYIIFAPQANNFVSELIIAGVQKSGATPYVGLTNAEQQTANVIQQAAQQNQSIVIDSHSRGTLTTDNAMQSIIHQGGIKDATGNVITPSIQLNNYGSAQKISTGNQTLQQLTGNNNNQINSVIHPRDLVGEPWLIGNNPATPSYTSTNPLLSSNQPTTARLDDGRGGLGNLWNTLFGTASPHNCYGTADKNCSKQWNFIPESNAIKITNKNYIAPVTVPIYKK